MAAGKLDCRKSLNFLILFSFELSFHEGLQFCFRILLVFSKPPRNFVVAILFDITHISGQTHTAHLKIGNYTYCETLSACLLFPQRFVVNTSSNQNIVFRFRISQCFPLFDLPCTTSMNIGRYSLPMYILIWQGRRKCV